MPSDASEYRINGRKVSEKDYQAKLKSVGLLVKSRNFLVFQNEVEKVAQKSPKELTELIERISGSEVCLPSPLPTLLPGQAICFTNSHQTPANRTTKPTMTGCRKRKRRAAIRSSDYIGARSL